jgi:hypothetical protein
MSVKLRLVFLNLHFFVTSKADTSDFGFLWLDYSLSSLFMLFLFVFLLLILDFSYHYNKGMVNIFSQAIHFIHSVCFATCFRNSFVEILSFL